MNKFTFLKYLSLTLTCLLFLACNNSASQENKIVPRSTASDSSKHILEYRSDLSHYIIIRTEKDSTKSYSKTKSDIKDVINNINIDNTSLDSVSKLVTELIINDIIPYWYGTKWDFNGYTATPNSGVIACGYFVSTVLKHAGLNIDRYKLAQQLPINEAKSIALDTEIIEIEIVGQLPSGYIQIIQDTLKEGLYFMGFDSSHVGFILNNGDQLYLMHSNYLNAEGVIIERIEDSNVYPMYSKFYFAEISTNKSLLEKWIKGEEIIIVKE